MIDPTENAYPAQELDMQGAPRMGMQWGLTKRELFAAMAMQGLLSSPSTSATVPEVCDAAVLVADALIAAINQRSSR